MNPYIHKILWAVYFLCLVSLVGWTFSFIPTYSVLLKFFQPPTHPLFIFSIFANIKNQKTDKIKIKTKTNITKKFSNEKNMLAEIPYISFCGDLPWNIDDILNKWHSFGQNWFSLCQRVFIALASWLAVECCVYFPLLVLGCYIPWTCTDLMDADSFSEDADFFPERLFFICSN